MMNVSGTTRLLGLIGNPIKHTISPAMHNASFAALNLDMIYLPFPTPSDSLRAVFEALKALNVLGVNVTLPYKREVMAYLDEVTPLAERIGAVNTIRFKNGKGIGYNTDGWGFTTSLEKELDFTFAGKRVVIIGAGGAARSVADRCLELKTDSLVIANRTESKGEALAVDLASHFEAVIKSLALADPKLAEEIDAADLVINTTSLGLEVGDPSPIPQEWLNENQIAADLIYNPVVPSFLQAAKSRGLHTINGLGMLIYQGYLAFEIWTGVTPPLEVMRAAVEKSLYNT